MYKYLLLLSITAVLCAQDFTDVYLLKSDSRHLLKDGDVLLEGDKIEFDLKSKREVKIYYQINKETKEALQVSESQNLILDSQRGELKFFFETKSGTKSITFYTNPELFSTAEDKNQKNTFLTKDRIYIDQTNVITNDRGVREADVIIPKLESSTVIINSDGKIGAGVIINDGKNILTNYHVVEPNEKNIYIALKPKDTYNPSKSSYYKAKLIKVDMLKDLALLELPKDLIEDKLISSMKMGNVKDLKKGIDIYNMGHPLGYYYAFEYGMLNNVLDNYSWTVHKAKKVLQYSMNSNRGNSGSPVINDKLELIGIGAFSNTKGSNLNFAISIEDIKEFLEAKKDVRFVKKDPNNYKDKIIQQGLNKNVRLAKLDRNGNGVPDAMMKDFDKDGKWDIIAYDTDEDGSYERVTSF